MNCNNQGNGVNWSVDITNKVFDKSIKFSITKDSYPQIIYIVPAHKNKVLSTTFFKLDELKVLIENLMEEDLISIKELYKLRSYMMADFIIEEIGKANKLIESLFLTNTHESAKEIYLNLKHMGLSSEIVESDYFLENKVMKK